MTGARSVVLRRNACWAWALPTSAAHSKIKPRIYSAARCFLGRPASSRSNNPFGSSRNTLATTPICQGITR